MRVTLSYLDVAKEAAFRAGALLMEYYGRVKEYSYKYKNSLVSEVDTNSEKLIVDIILSKFPTHGIYAEEYGEKNSSSDFRWIIDPLDGTTNYLHTYPFFSVSIALEIEGVVHVGVVYDPFKKEMFTAQLGKGAYLNGKPISTSTVDKLEESMVVTGFTQEHDWMFLKNLEHLSRFMHRAQAFRRDGSASLDLSYLASGRIDGFWEIGLHAWDVAAGYLILTEAGGKATNFSSEPLDIYGIEIVASNGLIHDQMIEVLNMGS